MNVAVIVNPATGRPLPKKSAKGGGITRAALGCNMQCRTLAGAVTVRAPLNPSEGSCFGVEDADGNAATHAITVEGAGALIDGATQILLNLDGAFASFIYDRGQWRRLQPARLLSPPEGPGAALLLQLMGDQADVPGSVAMVTGAAPITSTGGATPQIGINAATTIAAGSLAAADKSKLDTFPAAPGTAGNVLTSTGAAWVSAPGGASSNLTPLDANHLHAWELTDAGPDFADTGSSASPVPLVATVGVDAPTYGLSGLLGPCARFGFDPLTGASNSANARALTTLFADLPAGSASLEFWYRSVNNNLGGVCGVNDNFADDWSCFGGADDSFNAFIRATGAGWGALTPPAQYQCGTRQGWHYGVMTYDVATGIAVVYHDGEILQTRGPGITGSINWTRDATQRVSIGKGAGGGGGAQFYGEVSRVRLSDIARSQAYVRAVYKKAFGYT